MKVKLVAFFAFAALAFCLSADECLPDGGPYFREVGGVEYSFFVSNAQATVKSASNWRSAISDITAGRLVVPDTLGGCPVMHIGDCAFSDCVKLTEVSLPKNIKSIGAWSFSNCKRMSSINLPEGLIAIGERAFSYCEVLQMPSLPSSLLSIGDYAFESCVNANPVLILPSGITYVGDDVFNEEALVKIVFPESIKVCGRTHCSPGSKLVCVFEGTPPRNTSDTDYMSVDTSAIIAYDVHNAYSWECAYDGGGSFSRMIPYTPGLYDVNPSVGASVAHLTITNVVVQYVLNSVKPEIAVPVSGDAGFVNVITEVKSSGAVAVPSEWKANYPTFEAKFGTDFTKALMAKSGKVDAAKNELLVWQDFVAGTDPTDVEDKFTASVTMVEGVPVISWTPELPAEQANLRKYTTYGKAKLQDENWTVVNGDAANYNFFKVTVEMK